MTKEPLLLINKQSPGDCLVMTASIESLCKKHPNKYQIGVQTPCNAIYYHNPFVDNTLDRKNARVIEMEYPLIHQCNQRLVHFMQGYTEFLGNVLGVDLPLLVNKPGLYLSSEEKKWTNQVAESTGYKGKFWLIQSGTKNDYTTKGYGYSNYQQVVDMLYGRVQFVQVGEKHHNHRPLDKTINLIGKTDTRQLIRLAFHAQGAITGVSFLHHIMAAFSKPCVTLASGMEPKCWEIYNTGVYLSSHGMLSCCRRSSCWKSRVVPLNDDTKHDKSLCEMPIVGDNGDVIPKCLAMIPPELVVKHVEDYCMNL